MKHQPWLLQGNEKKHGDSFGIADLAANFVKLFGRSASIGFQNVFEKGVFLSINEVIAALDNENDSEIDSNSSSGLQPWNNNETTDDSTDEVQVPSMANVDPFFQVSLFDSDDNLQQVKTIFQKNWRCVTSIIHSKNELVY